MNDERGDWQQQAEAEQERMAHNLEALKRIEKAGLPDVARDLASELGLSDQYRQQERKVA